MIDITLEHPEYKSQRATWAKYRDLYSGGEQFCSRASEYLVRRQREPSDVYGERLDRVFYENYIGSVIDWYAATLFRREPNLILEGEDSSARSFFNSFADDCDQRGTAISDFLRRQFIEALVMGKSYLVVDFPRQQTKPASRAEEDHSGAARAYLAPFGVEQMTNWERDDQGEFEWVILRTERPLNPGLGGGGWATRRRWMHYNKQRFEIYEDVNESGRSGDPYLIDSGFHGLSTLDRVPVFEFGVTDGLWLMNKAASLQLEHFNKSNALSWALTMGLFAMPVVFSDRDWNQVLGDSYYLQLGPNDKFGWTEPAGHVFEIALANIDRLKDEIYRVCFLMSQAGGAMSKNASLSGLSKQRDYTVTQEVLRGYGDAAKDTLKRVLRAIVEARQDRLTVDVSGLDEFDIGDFSGELSDAANLLTLGVKSPTLRKQVYKKLAFKYLCDLRQEMKDRIAQEIDSQD
jgi:hypothetical protein